MRLNYRFILIAFVIVLIMSIASTLVFYSLAGSILSQQQSKSILNSANDFAFVFQNENQNIEEEFRLISPQVGNFNRINLDSTSIDFCFTLVNDSLINTREFKIRSESYLNIRSSSFRQFFSDNPNVILRYAQFPDGKTVYYGNLISSKYLNRISQKIRAEVALVINNFPVELSNPEKNQVYLLSIINVKDIISLKLEPTYGQFLRKEYKDIVPGYYLNKEHWNSIDLNGDVEDTLLKELIDQSYLLILKSLTKAKQKEILSK